jgi:hypothetical protein
LKAKLKEEKDMDCPKCGRELKPQSHYWPDPKRANGVVQHGLPEDWYSYSNIKPQYGGDCSYCGGKFIKIKNGDIYEWLVGHWELFSKAKNHRTNVKPIGGRWVQ